MTLIKHELKLNRKSFLIWTASIAFLIILCVFLYPEMKGEMDSVSEMFSSMGFFTDAFRMDQLDFGTLIGFYTIECGNIVGLGGAFFAALISVSVLAKEEKEHTAEFLFAHPVRRSRVLTEKLISVFIQIIIMNVVVTLLSLLSVAAIGETVPLKEMCLIHLAYFLMEIELACICFFISAFLRRGGLGIGLGLATLFYFFNIIGNLTKKAKAIKYFTPFSYTEGADIIAEGHLDIPLVSLGMLTAAVFVAAVYFWYCRKDLQ